MTDEFAQMANPDASDHGLSEVNRRMFKAIYLGKVDMLRRALKSGADPDVVDINRAGQRALHMAVKKGFVEIVKELLDHPNVNVDYVDRNGKHALDLARENSRPRIEEMLKEHVRMKSRKIWGLPYVPACLHTFTQNLIEISGLCQFGQLR